jgi:hypothetical protein
MHVEIYRTNMGAQLKKWAQASLLSHKRKAQGKNAKMVAKATTEVSD